MPARHALPDPTTLRRRLLATVVAALLLPGCDPGTSPPLEELAAELHVTHIARLPRIPPPDTTAPPDAGWPDVGATVQWVAHVHNTGTETAPDVAYVWRVDGGEVAAGRVTIPPGEATVTLERAWAAEREEIEVELTGVPEPDPAQHALSIRSDALGVDLYMEASLAEWVRTHTGKPFPVWAGREVRAWAGILDGYTPRGSRPSELLDRIRLDSVAVLLDGAEWPSLVNDLLWFWSARLDDARFINGVRESSIDDQTIVLHELLHRRGVADLYSYTVEISPYGSEVRILDPDGTPAVEGDHMWVVETRGSVVRYYKMRQTGTLMDRRYVRPVSIDPLTAYGLNQVAGRRTLYWRDEFDNHVYGFARPGPVQNPYLWDLPDSLAVEVWVNGEPTPGARLEVFFDHATETYQNRYLEHPDAVVEADTAGIATVSLDPIQALPDQGASADADVIIFRVTDGDAWEYEFFPVYLLNRAYIEGAHDVATATLFFLPF